MGKVVTLEPQAKDGPRRHSTRRPKRSKTALVLGGGGFTGGLYEIGALRALDLLTVNRTVNDFDVYVGTSVGSFVAAMMVNGVRPEEMMRVLDNQRPAAYPNFEQGSLLRPNLLGFARSAVALPLRAAQFAAEVVGTLGNVSVVDFALGIADALPAGAYTTAGIERYTRSVLEHPDRTNDFRELSAEFYVTATDLDRCERVVLGVPGWDDIPISTAVGASTAVPMLYTPVAVRDRELVDGGVLSTTNIDLAVDAGAKLIVILNPLVPYVNDFNTKIRTLHGTRTRHISDMGFPQIGMQAYKMIAHQRLHEMSQGWEQRYPGVDIILIEPESDDELMFQTPVMNYASRVAIARHGFQSVTTKLAFGYPQFQEICKRHGIEISADRVRKVMKHFEAEQGRTRAWRKILEQTTGALLRQLSEDQAAADESSEQA